jgi:hypothetical protein
MMADTLKFCPEDHAPHPHHKAKGGHKWAKGQSTNTALRNRLVKIMEECADGTRKTITTSKDLLTAVKEDSTFGTTTPIDINNALRLPDAASADQLKAQLADAFKVRVSYLVAKPVYLSGSKDAYPTAFEYGTDCGCGLVDPE